MFRGIGFGIMVPETFTSISHGEPQSVLSMEMKFFEQPGLFKRLENQQGGGCEGDEEVSSKTVYCLRKSVHRTRQVTGISFLHSLEDRACQLVHLLTLLTTPRNGFRQSLEAELSFWSVGQDRRNSPVSQTCSR
jgi:hypothetical protein